MWEKEHGRKVCRPSFSTAGREALEKDLGCKTVPGGKRMDAHA